MNADNVSCPYCNAQFAEPAAVTGPRLNCPRCGESFPYRSSAAIQSEPGSPSPAAALSLAPPAAERWSNRRLAITVLGVMGVMAAVGLTFALLTVKDRRSHDPQPPPPPPPPLLAYLPPGTNLVLNINVAEAVRTPTGRAFLDQAEMGNLGFRFSSVEKAVGLNRDNLEQVVIAVKTDGLQIVILARSRRPYNVKQVRDTLKAETATKVGKKEAYHFQLAGTPWSPLVWPADDWTVIVADSTRTLQAVPDAPPPEGNGLPAALQEIRKERIPGGTQVWLAATLDGMEVARPLLEPKLGKENVDALLGVRSLAFALRLEEAVKLDAAFQSKDEASAEALLKLLSHAKNTTYLKVLGPQSGGEKVAAELAKNLTGKRDGKWVLLETSANADTVQQALKGDK